MKKVISVILLLGCIGGALYASRAWTEHRPLDERVAQFNEEADRLIQGLQQYREFAGSYPNGNNIALAKALQGQGEKKIVILAVRKSSINDKGEIVDPWGTPLRFYFSDNEILIRSAGPNKVWQDSAVPLGDDLYRSTPKDNK
jgi:hypothetical protein